MVYLLLIISLLLANHGIQGTSFGSSTKDLKQPVNFSGKITTHQGQQYVVDNISINNLYKKIPMYAKPSAHAEATMNQTTKHMEIKLTENPPTDFVKATIDLDELKEIQVPKPDTIWYYQQKENSQKIEYLEIIVTTKSNTKNFYLLERKTPIYCDEIDAAGPQEKTIPLAALKTLTIEGYTYRDTSKEKKECIPCSAKN
jgi:hypothetical protein